MPTIEDAIVALLEADSAVTTAAPGGIWPDVLTPGSTVPALRYLSVSDMPLIASDGRSATHRVRIQIDAFAETRGEADDAAQAVLDALCPSPNVRRTVSGVVIDGVIPDLGRAGRESTTKLYWRARDFVVWGGTA